MSALLFKFIKLHVLLYNKKCLIFHCHLKLMLLFDPEHTRARTQARAHTLAGTHTHTCTHVMLIWDNISLPWRMINRYKNETFFFRVIQRHLSSVPDRYSVLSAVRRHSCLGNMSSVTERNLHMPIYPFLHDDSDQTVKNAQANLSLRWGHILTCSLC